jgi:hypothetical protein
MSHEPVESEARAQLRAITTELDTLRLRLVAVHAALPVSPSADLMHLGEEEPDFPTEARRTIECTLFDHLEPMLRDLATVADYESQPAASL